MANSQLQIINDKLQQEGFNSSLMARRQEMRRRMSDGNYDADTTDQATQPTEIKSLSTNSEGGAPTLASTYGNLLNNYQATSSKLSNLFGQGSESSGSTNLPSWLSPAVNMGLGLSGHGELGTIASGAMDAMSGNMAGTASKMAGLTASKLFGSSKLPGLPGLFSNLVGGLVAGQDGETIAKNMGNSAIGTALGIANPVLGIGYGLARMFGFDPAYGFNNLFGDGLKGVAPGFTGTAGGFFGKNALGSGIKSTEANIANSGYSSGGSSSSGGYTPYGYSSGDLGSGITSNSSGSGISGYGISTPSYSWGSSGSSSATSQTYGAPNTGVGSGFNSAGWGMSSSSNNSSDSGGD